MMISPQQYHQARAEMWLDLAITLKDNEPASAQCLTEHMKAHNTSLVVFDQEF